MCEFLEAAELSFRLSDLTGCGPYAAGRFTFDWNVQERHGLRVEVAPLRIDENGTFGQPVTFAGQLFPRNSNRRQIQI